MTLTEALVLIPDWIEAIALIMLAITTAATVIVRLTPSKTDDEKVSKFANGLLRVLSFLPTIGVNPRTKKMEEALKQVEATAPEAKEKAAI